MNAFVAPQPMLFVVTRLGISLTLFIIGIFMLVSTLRELPQLVREYKELKVLLREVKND